MKPSMLFCSTGFNGMTIHHYLETSSMDKNIFFADKKPKGYYTHDRKEILKYIPHFSRNILDIGCGSGNFGKLLKSQMDAVVWGIELFRDAAAEAAAKIDNVIVGDIEQDNLNLPANYFDCIIFNDILEHLKYPWNVLRNSKVLLKNEGYIVASIPNVRYYPNVRDLLVNKNWEYKDEGILDKTHLRFFTDKTVKEMFIECGYYIIKFEGINEYQFSRKLKVLNLLLKNTLSDMKYLQFVVVAQKQ